MSEDPRQRARALADRSADGLDWFDAVYASARGDPSQIPWADSKPNPNLVAWLEREQPRGRGVKAIVVGCGLGEDAELLSRWGFAVTAFDFSPTAIEWCKRRVPGTCVKYAVADLLNLPPDWHSGFGFVFEAYTLQSLPATLRPRAIAATASLVAPEGRLLVIARGRDNDGTPTGPPWPLTQAEVGTLQTDELRMESFEDYEDREEPPVRRFRAAFVRR